MTNIKIAAAAAATMLNASLAFAQGAADSAKAKTESTHPQTEIGERPGNEVREDWTQKESLVLEKLRDDYIADSGFTPVVSWAGEQWSNISGGLDRGTTWDSLFTFGFEQEVSKLAKTDGLGTIGLSAFYYTESGVFDEKLGAMSSPSNIFSGEMVRVFEIFYRNEIETEYGTFGVRLGQLAADEDFMGMDYADIFLNSSFGAIPAVAGNSLYGGENVAFSQYSLATLGATAYWSKDAFDAILGVYNGNAGRDLSGNHGFDYALEGVALWYQLGCNYEVGGLSGRVMFGGNYHSGKFEDYRTGDPTRNFYSFFLGLQQDVLADDKGEAILGIFCRLAWAPDENVADITKYIDAGINWFSPIPGREDDIFAIGVSAMETGSAFRELNDVSKYETMMEATYRIQITKAIALQPCFQMYFTPPNADGEPETAYVAGARLEINF